MTNFLDKDLYKILNVKKDATLMEIRSAYRKLARIYHPDISEDQESIAIFKDIRQAYEILSDDEKRKLYDIKHGVKLKPEDYAEQVHEPIPENDPLPDEEKEIVSEVKKEKQKTKKLSHVLSEIFDGIFIFGKKTSNKSKNKAQESADIYANVTISTKEAILGTSRIINVVQTKLCPNCEGKKFINEALCPLCKGNGEISNHKKINTKIPPNIKDGDKIKIDGVENQSKDGVLSGDLYLIVKIDEKSLFSIKDDIVYMDLPVSPFEAVLGANIEIPTFYENITIKIPPNTSSGQRFRLKGQGIYLKDKGINGDMIVTVFIKIPPKLSDKEIELYKSLRENCTCNIREGLKSGE